MLLGPSLASHQVPSQSQGSWLPEFCLRLPGHTGQGLPGVLSAPPGMLHLDLPLPTPPHPDTKAALSTCACSPPFTTCFSLLLLHLTHSHRAAFTSTVSPYGPFLTPPPFLNMGRLWFRRGQRKLTKDT